MSEETAPRINWFPEGVKTIKIADLLKHPANYRTHPRYQIDSLRASLRKHGQEKPVVIFLDPDLSEEQYVIHAGHGMVEAMQAEGWTEVWYSEYFGTDAEQYLVDDNETGLTSMPNDKALLTLLQKRSAADLSSSGWEPQHVAALEARMNSQALREEKRGSLDGGAEKMVTVVECPHCKKAFEPKPYTQKLRASEAEAKIHGKQVDEEGRVIEDVSEELEEIFGEEPEEEVDE